MSQKPYNLTYFITFIAVATFADHKYITSNRKLYKMCYMEDFIMKILLDQHKIYLSKLQRKVILS